MEYNTTRRGGPFLAVPTQLVVRTYTLEKLMYEDSSSTLVVGFHMSFFVSQPPTTFNFGLHRESSTPHFDEKIRISKFFRASYAFLNRARPVLLEYARRACVHLFSEPD